jgi:hypothetical protein
MAEIFFEDPTDAEDPQSDFSTLLQDVIAGGIAGSAGIFAGHPLDTLKVRLQLPTSRRNQDVPKGYRGLFRGLGAPLSTAALVNATSFTTVRLTCNLWDEHFRDSNNHSSSDFDNDVFTIHRTLRNCWSGFLAGLLSSVWLAPSEHIKVRLQASSSSSAAAASSVVAANMIQQVPVVYTGTIDAFRQIYQSHGVVTGLYRGMAATMARQGPGFAVYFAVYEPVKEYLLQYWDQTVWTSSILAGGTAGFVSWGVIYPIDVLKSRIQTAPLDAPKSERSMVAVAQRIFQVNGGKSLYRGVVLTVLRAFPVNAIIFTVYELSLEHLFGRHV